MPQVSFSQLMKEAGAGNYAVGYFESWDSTSLLAVADAAVLARSPVLLGFSGLNPSHPARLVRDPLSAYAALGLEVCRQLPVPAALVYNESPDPDDVFEAARLGFSLVMYSDPDLGPATQQARVRKIAKDAHQRGAAVEGEIRSLPGMRSLLTMPVSDVPLTNIDSAMEFVNETKIDALAVNLGQMHLHGRHRLGLDLERLEELNSAVGVPLVLHGASSIRQDALKAAIARGIRKINVGSLLKQTYFETIRDACRETGEDYNPYLVVGSGLEGDVLTAARLALRDRVIDLMHLFGSANKA